MAPLDGKVSLSLCTMLEGALAGYFRRFGVPRREESRLGSPQGQCRR